MPEAYILGIESSCDETAAAVVRSGEQVISNVVASQIATHQPYGGVVPELASREHLRAIVPVVRQALAEANQTYNSVDAIDPLDRGIDELARGDLSARDERGLGGGVEECEVVGHGRAA